MKKTDYENLGALLMQKRKSAKMTQAQLAQIMGVDPKTIYRWESGSTSVPKSKTIVVSNFIQGVDVPKGIPITISTVKQPQFMIKTGRGKSGRAAGKSSAPADEGENAELETRPHIPAEVAAGALNGLNEAIMEYDCEQSPIIKRFSGYDMTITVKGNSMEPKYEGGDELAIKEVSSFIEWGKPHVLSTRDGAVLKRIYDEGECYRCVSYNSEYPDFMVRKDDVFGVYRIVGLIRI